MSAVPSSPRVKLRATSRRVPRARPLGGSPAEVVEPEPEPNMKLSRALVVMLLLHIVAIGGILAFSLIKDHDAPRKTADAAAGSQNASEAEDGHLPPSSVRDTAEGSARPAVHVVRQGETLTRIANANGVSLEALVAANGTGGFSGGIHPGQQLRLPEKVSPPASQPSTPGNEALNLIEQKSGDAGLDADIAAANGANPAGKTPGRPPADSGQTYTVGKGESPYTIARKLKVNAEALLKLNGIDDPKKIQPGQKLRLPVRQEAKGKPDAKPKLGSKAKLKA